MVGETLSAGDLFGLSGKAAIVIGGGLGMGEASSLAMAQAGCDVAVIDIDAGRAENVAGKVRALGRNGVAVIGDVLDPDQPARIVAEAEEKLGRIDAMISIVGQAGWYSFLDMTIEDWALDHNRNLRYFALCAQAAARAMVRRGAGGAITAIASVSGLQSAPHHAAYGAAKAGLVNLVKTMAVELAPHAIRVNAIAPGSIATPRITAGPHAARHAEKIRSSPIPFKRAGMPEEVAKAALFMSSDLASYVSGQTLAVDGGWTAAFLLGTMDDR